jgi:hypothetical protein
MSYGLLEIRIDAYEGTGLLLFGGFRLGDVLGLLLSSCNAGRIPLSLHTGGSGVILVRAPPANGTG